MSCSVCSILDRVDFVSKTHGLKSSAKLISSLGLQ